MKTAIFIASAIILFGVSSWAQDGKMETTGEERKSAGVTIGVDYYSNYLWRGTRFYDNDGAFIPALSWDVAGSGLILGVAMELSTSYFFEGFQRKPKEFYFSKEDFTPYRKKLKMVNSGYVNHSLDFGVDYSHTFAEVVTFGISVWYWWYFNHRTARDLAIPIIKELNTGYVLRDKTVDLSFLSTVLTIGFDFVPFLMPEISFSHDWYTMEKKAGDFYVQLSLGHDFELTKEVTIGIGSSAGYYYYRTGEMTRFYIDFDPTTISFVNPSKLDQRMRIPIIKGVSDITTKIELAFSKGPISLNGGFYWVAVPAKSWYKGDTVHRYFAKVGVSCSL